MLRLAPALLPALVSTVTVGCGGGGGDATRNTSPGLVQRAMSAARAAHTVTTLANGDLLIAGGIGAGFAPLAGCEVFDASAAASTDAIVPTGAMALPRARHTATLLASGRVVVIGGSSAGATEEFAPHATTPSAGVWSTSATAVLATPRSRHAAVRLLDGRVLVVGGEDAGGLALGSCELYVDAASPMTPAAPLSTPRRDATATLLPDGRVLVVGGRDAAGVPLATAEVYAPGTNTWTTPASTLAAARSLHVAQFLDGADANPANDRVWIAGGADAAGDGVGTAELFDPATNTFSPGGPLEGPGVFDAASVVLANGQAALVGGFVRGGATASVDPVRESIVYRLGATGGVGAQDVPQRRGAARAATLASGGPAGSSVVLAGGFAPDGNPSADVWVFPIFDEMTALANSIDDEEALAVGTFATAFHLFDDGLVGGGDADLRVVDDPIRGRTVRGWVGNFEVDLEVDAGAVVGNVEGKPYGMTIDHGYVAAPDFQVDFRPSGAVEGDMDVDDQDFDFDVGRSPGLMRGFVTGYDDEAELRLEFDGDHTDPDRSWLDVYWI